MNLSEFLNADITIDDVKCSIKTLAYGKSAGNDGLNAEFYKCTTEIFPPFLCRLFNNILTTGIVPDSWGESIVCPVYKAGPQYDPNNYRGISITTTMYKIFFKYYKSTLVSLG